MAAKGRDGGQGRWNRSYRREQTTGSSSFSSSNRSGTVVSTGTYTYPRSSASCLSSVSMDLVSSIEERNNGLFMDGTEIKVRHIQRLVEEFFGTQAWALHLPEPDGASAKELNNYAPDTPSWIRALNEIMKTIQEILGEEPETEIAKQPGRLDHFQIAQFFQQTMLKMLGYFDIIVKEDVSTGGMPVPKVNLSTLLHVYVALSTALSEFRFRLHWPYSAQVKRIESEMVSLLSAKEDRAHAAIWSTLERRSIRVLESMEESLGTETPQASSGIHKLTCSVVRRITFVLENHSALAPIVSKPARLGKYVPQTRHLLPFDSMIMEMVASLEGKLVNMSESFPDQGLGFLFLLNNSDFMQGSLRSCIMSFPQIIVRYSSVVDIVEALLDKVDGYMERYLQASWAPLLSCLLNPTPLCFRKNYSPLSKFESEFWETYTTQKLGKVLDPARRKRLREAIIEKIIPSYTDYIEINNVTTPTIAPHELQEMLQELFEG